MNKILINLMICILYLNVISALDKNDHCKCRIKTSKRIIGGRVVHHTDYPWIASLAVGPQSNDKSLRKMLPENIKIKKHNCGAVIVNENWAITAAHCIRPKYSDYSIGVGNNNDLVKIFDEGRIKVKTVHVHPGFDKRIPNNDLALLELESPINFTNYVLPGCLDTNINKDYGRSIMLVGYGLTAKVIKNSKTGDIVQRGLKSRYLKELEYKDISGSVSKCYLYRSLLCVDSVNGIEESGCYGDSGSPMHSKSINGQTTIIGLASGTDYDLYEGNNVIHCNGKSFFTRIGYHLNWIESYIGKNNHC